jgi:iron complex transport system substrate-binding protein
MLYVLGVWERVVGVSRFCDVPPEARQLPTVGSGMDPDLERILSLEPDLVVGIDDQQGFPFVSALREVGVPIFLVADESLDEMYASMRELGELLGVAEAADREVGRIERELADIRRRIEGLARPRVLIVFDRDPIYAAGPDTLIGRLVDIAGGDNVVTSGEWVQLDREQAIQLAPDVILEPRELSDGDPVGAWAPLSTVPAVRDGRIYTLSSHGISRPGPGAPAAAREIAARLFPERFTPGAP